jgi:hypothetical protein
VRAESALDGLVLVRQQGAVGGTLHLAAGEWLTVLEDHCGLRLGVIFT